MKQRYRRKSHTRKFVVKPTTRIWLDIEGDVDPWYRFDDVKELFSVDGSPPFSIWPKTMEVGRVILDAHPLPDDGTPFSWDNIKSKPERYPPHPEGVNA